MWLLSRQAPAYECVLSTLMSRTKYNAYSVDFTVLSILERLSPYTLTILYFSQFHPKISWNLDIQQLDE